MAGRILMTILSIGHAIGPFAADYNETHIFNPRWPPHAKFHDAQVLSFGLCISAAMIYFTWRPKQNVERYKDDLFTAALFGSMYWVSGLSAILYPGTAGMDPEFGEGFPQSKIFVGALIGVWFAWGIEILRLNEKKKD